MIPSLKLRLSSTWTPISFSHVVASSLTWFADPSSEFVTMLKVGGVSSSLYPNESTLHSSGWNLRSQSDDHLHTQSRSSCNFSLSHHFWCEYHFVPLLTLELLSIFPLTLWVIKNRSHLLSLNWQCFKSRTCLCSVRNILPHDGSRRQEPGQRQAWYSSRSAKYIGSRTGKAVEQIVLFIKHNLYGNAYHGYWCIPWQYITLLSLQ